jgi:hypothetical protein
MNLAMLALLIAVMVRQNGRGNDIKQSLVDIEKVLQILTTKT